jgi:hypothetical protein
MNIKRKLTKKVAVAFPDTPVKPVTMPRPATNVKPVNIEFKSFFNSLKKTAK